MICSIKCWMPPLGYLAAEVKAPPRRELADIVFYEKYGRH
jgi:hypothetical protein